MTLSLDRMKALLRRLSPSWPSTEPDTSVGKELDSIALALSYAADRVDVALDEVFPDTTTELIDRWERITGHAPNTTMIIDYRRFRVLSVLRRLAGPRLAQLEQVLAGPFDLSVEDIVFFEPLRQFIEAALTVEDTTSRVLSAAPTLVYLGAPWPGKVDDYGVALYLESTSAGGTYSLTSPSGKTLAIAFSGTGWYRVGAGPAGLTSFSGVSAAGLWTVSMAHAGASTVSNIKLLVSNDVDSAQIYNLFALRDRSLAGSPDIAEAQRLLSRTAHAHNRARVIQDTACIVGLSPCGREPSGSN